MEFLLNLFAQLPAQGNPFSVAVFLFASGGWVFVLFAILSGLFWVWLYWRQNLFFARQQYVLLAIDVPRDNEQTPKAVEHVFSHIHGIHKNPNLIEKYIDGYLQPAVSLELISIDGFIQYLVRTPVRFRDLVEAAIYAQYPNAEIAEVEDYTRDAPTEWPNERYRMWGAEITLVNKDVYPIRTYPAFEHPLTQTFLDPMASLLEIMGRLRVGEQIWLQWVITPPPDDSWRRRGIRAIKKLIGAKAPPAKSRLDVIGWLPNQVIQGLSESFTAGLGTLPFGEADFTAKRDNVPPSLMLHLAPFERNIVESIGFKISKLTFSTKFRFVYLATKETFDKIGRVGGVFGALKQLAALDLNGFKPEKKTKTTVDYFFKHTRENARARRLMWGYKYRSNWRGRNRYMLNIEELATLWHFPVITVKAPLVQKSQAKRGEPPIALPTGQNPVAGQASGPLRMVRPTAPPPPGIPSAPPAAPPARVPENLPVA